MSAIEIEINKNQVSAADFIQLLGSMESGKKYVVDCSKSESLSSSDDEIQIVLQQMVDKAADLILLAPAHFEKAVEKIKNSKFHYVIKKDFLPNSDIIQSFEDYLIDICFQYWSLHFPVMIEFPVDRGDQTLHEATFTVVNGNNRYQGQLLMNLPAMTVGIKKYLNIDADLKNPDELELQAEVLNILAGHLRSKLKNSVGGVSVGIPQKSFHVSSTIPGKIFYRMSAQTDDWVLEFNLYKEV